MTQPKPTDIYERTMKMLKPALERVATDAEFRNRLELDPLGALAELNVELDADTQRDLEGKRFSEFWAERRQSAEGVVGIRELPPEDGTLTDQELDSAAGGRLSRFAPPYVPV